MRNIKFIFAALVFFAALSCQKESFPQATPETNSDENLVPLVLTTGVETKTYIAANGTDVYWHSDDKIKVYSNYIISDILGDEATSYEFAMPSDYVPNDNFAKFTGLVRPGTTGVWAVYPYNLAGTANVSGIIEVNLPASQDPYNGNTNSFGQNLNISIGKVAVTVPSGLTDKEPTAAENMTFYNVCSLLKFTVPEGVNNIKSVKITANTAIAGDMTFDYGSDKDKPVFNGITRNSSESITMTATSSNSSESNTMTATPSFAAGRDYYFVVAPVAISELSIFVNTTDNKQYGATNHFDAPVQLQAGKHKNLGTLNLGNMPSFGVGFDIQDEEGILNGTNVIFTFPSPTITNVDLKVKKGETTVRSIQEASLELDENNQYTSSCFAESVSTWPYLPKDTYVISGSYVADGIPVTVSGLELKIEESPNFTVGSFEAKTSYTVYKSGADNAVALANQFDGTKIEVTASEVKISDKILNNANYKDLFKVQFATSPYGDNYSANLANGVAVTLTGQKVGSYASPSYVFDTTNGVTLDKTVCHVTGIPYTLANDGTWKDSGTLPGPSKWSDTGTSVILGNGKSLSSWLSWDFGSTTTLVKTFYTPEDIVVAIAVTGKVGGSKYSKTTGKVVVSNTTAYEKKDCKSKDLQNMDLKTSTPTLLSNNPTVTLSNSDSSRLDDRRTEILSLTIRYN